MGRSPLHLVVDARTVRLARTGIGNAVFRHLQGIERLLAAGRAVGWRVSVIRFAPELRHEGFRRRWDGFSHLHFIESTADHTQHPRGDLWQQWTLPRLLRAMGADVVYSPAYVGPLATPGTARLIMIHDDMIWSQKDSYPPKFRHYLATGTRLSARTAHRIVFPSDDARRTCARLLSIPARRTGVVPHGVDDEVFFPGNAPQSPPYAVCIASAEKRKNHEVLVEALKGQSTLRLRFIGFSAEETARLESLRAIDGGANWEVVPHAAEREIAAHLHGAAMLLLASRGEGFGIPVVEAMATGTPLILSDIPVFREVAGDAALYRQVDDAAAWREGILEVLRGGDAVKERVERGLERARDVYTLENCARRLLAEARLAWKAMKSRT